MVVRVHRVIYCIICQLLNGRVLSSGTNEITTPLRDMYGEGGLQGRATHGRR